MFQQVLKLEGREGKRDLDFSQIFGDHGIYDIQELTTLSHKLSAVEKMDGPSSKVDGLDLVDIDFGAQKTILVQTTFLLTYGLTVNEMMYILKQY